MRNATAILFNSLLLVQVALFSQEPAKFTDERDGHEYKCVKIGNQVWMAENMVYTPKENKLTVGGNLINFNGILYNWETAQKVCPTGWHLPTLGDWNNLINYIAEKHSDCSLKNNLWENTGKYLKSKDAWRLIPETSNATDEYGFNAKATGWGDEKKNYTIGNDTYWWTSTPQNETQTWVVKLWSSDQNLLIEEDDIESYRNVRCLNGINPDIPFVELNSLIRLEKNKIRLASTLVSGGSAEIEKYGFRYQAYSDITFTEISKNKLLKKGKDFTADITLNYGVTYTYYSFAENKNSKAESEKKVFIIYPDSTFFDFGKNKNKYQYLKGQEKLMVRITATDTNSKLDFPGYSNLTNSQKVLRFGKDSDNKSFVDLELAINIPEEFKLTSAYPAIKTEMPDSVLQFLSLANYNKEEFIFFKDYLNNLINNKKYTYQFEIVEDVIGWIRSFISYDYSLSIDQEPMTVLNRRTATCAGYANLGQVLFRSVGIPCRIVSCIVPPNCGWGFLQSGGRHAFIEIYYPGHGWVAYDPQNSIHFVDLFHIVDCVPEKKFYNIPDNINYQFLENENHILQCTPKAFISGSEKMYCADVQQINDLTPLCKSFAFIEIIEKKDGSKYPLVDNSIVQVIINNQTGAIESVYKDGIRKIIYPDGKREIFFKSGEIHTDYIELD
jgi:uncharacterized protein (TIGR02145 family)